MKIMVTAEEAVEKGVWPQVQTLFGRDAGEEFWPREEFILTEEQALELKLISKP
ncbi:hypothetical protein ACP26L_25195 [Paenibacillus sp. S-38]|uniref:hypothetical protein n=1 Tax=Paenibacillus sp. S-38 TaxID=3416710 RepID=UPI003CF4E1A7